MEFITEVIPDRTTIDSVELNLNCIQWIISNEDHDIWSMENKPSDSDAMTVYDDAANGACYIGNYLSNPFSTKTEIRISQFLTLRSRAQGLGISSFQFV